MQKKICFTLSLAVIYLAESAPVKLGTLEFDNLDIDLSDLGYEVEEEDLDDFSKFLDETSSKPKSNNKDTNNKDVAISTTNENTSGFNKQNTDTIGVKDKYKIGGLKEILKLAGGHDLDTYDIADLFALAGGIAAAAAGETNNESRTYKKGTKTRGFHRVHHKDEYKKDQEFYEDDETKGTINKVKSNAIGGKVGAGASFNKGHFHQDRQRGIYGKQGYLDKGYLDEEINKYIDAKGRDSSF